MLPECDMLGVSLDNYVIEAFLIGCLYVDRLLGAYDLCTLYLGDDADIVLFLA